MYRFSRFLSFLRANPGHAPETHRNAPQRGAWQTFRLYLYVLWDLYEK